MKRDDRVLHENVTPILPYQVQAPRPRRTIDDWQRNLLEEVDDLHANDRRIAARVTLAHIGVAGLVWHALGFWPVPFLWDVAATSWFTVFVTTMVVFMATAGALAALPSLVRRYGWMS